MEQPTKDELVKKFVPVVGEAVYMVEGGGVILTTAFNQETKEGSFKFFTTLKEFEAARHEESLKKFPDWHKLECPTCKDKENENVGQ